MNSLPRNAFRQALRSEQRVIGLWCNFANHVTVEVLTNSGFDWLLLDMEHSPADFQIVGQQLLAMRGSSTAPIVRVPILDMVSIKRVLDAGAPNVMVPNVRSADEARFAVACTRFPPQGQRGVAGSTRAGGYTRYRDYMARANDEIGVIVQIESREALADLAAICAVDDVDAVFIGPSDLAAALGHRGNPGHPDVQAAIAQAIATARAARKAIGILVVDGNAAPYLEQGATLVGVGTDLHLLLGAADRLAASFKVR